MFQVRKEHEENRLSLNKLLNKLKKTKIIKEMGDDDDYLGRVVLDDMRRGSYRLVEPQTVGFFAAAFQTVLLQPHQLSFDRRGTHPHLGIHRPAISLARP